MACSSLRYTLSQARWGEAHVGPHAGLSLGDQHQRRVLQDSDSGGHAGDSYRSVVSHHKQGPDYKEWAGQEVDAQHRSLVTRKLEHRSAGPSPDGSEFPGAKQHQHYRTLMNGERSGRKQLGAVDQPQYRPSQKHEQYQDQQGRDAGQGAEATQRALQLGRSVLGVHLRDDGWQHEVSEMINIGKASRSSSPTLIGFSIPCVPSEEILLCKNKAAKSELAAPAPTEASITVLRSVWPTVANNSAKQASSMTLIIRPALLPPVARPPNRVAIRMSWNPLNVSAIISCIEEIAIQPAVSPITATRAEE